MNENTNESEYVEKDMFGVRVGYIKVEGKVAGLLSKYAVSLFYKGKYTKKNIIADSQADFDNKLEEVVFVFKLNKDGGK